MSFVSLGGSSAAVYVPFKDLYGNLIFCTCYPNKIRT